MTVIRSDFDFQNPEFTSQAMANRRKRRRKITPILRWEFHKDMTRMLLNIRNMRPSIDNNPPQSPSTIILNRNRQMIEESRLRVIEFENHQILERLQKIHNRPRSYFCHLKKRGVPLVKGDAYRLHPPTRQGLSLVQSYKKLKLNRELNNSMAFRKSIQLQQNMLTSAIELVKQSSKSKASNELIDSVVQMKLDTVEEISSPDTASLEAQEIVSPIELVKLANTTSGAKLPNDFGNINSRPSISSLEEGEH